VNGCARPCAVEPETPLIWVLRERLGLMGTEYGCGTARCGACTVLLDDVAIRSCATPVGRATGDITTIEGLDPGALALVEDAWRAEKVPQCGYCRSGQIMAAVALLAHAEDPDDADIARAMAGRLCRHDTYPQIRKAIRRAAAAWNAARPPGKTGAPGQPGSSSS
jgi:isoquinoline 1-oxidoreductase alpha subunit